MTKNAHAERLISLLAPILLLLAWEVCARLALIDTRFFPAPSAVLVRLWAMVVSGALWKDLVASLYRIGAGMLIGSVPAILLGLIMGLSRWVRAAIMPMIAATYPIPKSAILPLILLIFGLGESSKIAMVTIGVFFPVLINTMAGVLQIGRIHFDVGKNFGASRPRMIRTIALPGALPLILTGLKLGMGMALILVVIAEIVGAKSGIGYMLHMAWTLFDVELMYVGLIVISLLGFISTVLLDEVERILVPWKPR